VPGVLATLAIVATLASRFGIPRNLAVLIAAGTATAIIVLAALMRDRATGVSFAFPAAFQYGDADGASDTTPRSVWRSFPWFVVGVVIAAHVNALGWLPATASGVMPRGVSGRSAPAWSGRMGERARCPRNTLDASTHHDVHKGGVHAFERHGIAIGGAVEAVVARRTRDELQTHGWDALERTARAVRCVVHESILVTPRDE